MHPIAELFRHYNVIDYKSPDDYFSLDDYDRVLAYTRLHHVLEESKEDLWKQYTITCISSTYPKAMIHQIKQRGIRVEEHRPIHGIYQIYGEIYPIQIVVLNRMDDPEYIWPFSPYLSQERRKKCNAFTNLLSKKIESPCDNNIRDLIDFTINNLLYTNSEWEEVWNMRASDKFTKDEIKNMIDVMRKSPITKEWQQEMKEEAKKEAKEEAKIELKDEVRDEVRDEIRDEVRNEVRNELMIEMKNKV